MHKAENFTMQVVSRADIKFAEYNPRKITDKAKKRLREAIGKVGMLAPITWNKATGRVVSGHQRLKALDALEKTKDYSITVAVVDLTEDQEKAANVLFNNADAQGEFDLEALAKLAQDPGFDLSTAGMGEADLYDLLGEETPAHVMEAIEEAAKDINKREEKYSNDGLGLDPYMNDFYCVVVFKDYAARKAWTEANGLDDNRYVSGSDL